MKAKIISFKRETSIQIAIFETKSSPSCAVKCEFFMDENSNEYLFVHSIESNLDIGKAKEVTGSLELFEKTDVETFELIGYEKPFLSPIGIYGVTICLDKPLTEKKELLCRISERAFLVITPEEIIESNENVLVEEIAILKK